MRHLVLFIHGDESSVRRMYTDALRPLGEVDLVFINCGAYSSPYAAEGTNLRDTSGRVLPRLLGKWVPTAIAARKHDTLSVVSFSAGYGLAREILRSSDDRGALDAYVALDSVHSAPIGTAASKVQLQPFADYATRAKNGQCLMWLSHTDVQTPQLPAKNAFASTTQVAEELLKLTGGTGGNWFVRSYNTRPASEQMGEHSAALVEWGPSFVAEALVPYLSNGWRGTPDPGPVDLDPAPVPWRDRSLSLAQRCVILSRHEMESGVQEEPLGSNTSPRIREYFEPAYRRATGAYLKLTSGDWCAASACWVARECALPYDGTSREVVPHGYHASGIEIQDSAKASGAWRPVGTYAPKPGDVCILKRGTEAWQRHVCRVELPPDANGKFPTLGGNENNKWSRTIRSLNDPALLGFVEYP